MRQVLSCALARGVFPRAGRRHPGESRASPTAQQAPTSRVELKCLEWRADAPCAEQQHVQHHAAQRSRSGVSQGTVFGAGASNATTRSETNVAGCGQPKQRCVPRSIAESALIRVRCGFTPWVASAYAASLFGRPAIVARGRGFTNVLRIAPRSNQPWLLSSVAPPPANR